MASINNEPVSNNRRAGFARRKQHTLKIDMTPMVDLGFLLITFFIFTTTMSTPKAMPLIVPDDKQSPEPPTRTAKSTTLSVLLGENDKVFYYHGKWDEAVATNTVYKTSWNGKTGIRNIIQQKQRDIDALVKTNIAFQKKFPKGREEMMVLIKPMSQSIYKNVVDLLDEMLICDVKKYAIVEPDKEEKAFFERDK